MRPRSARGWSELFLHVLFAFRVVALSSATLRWKAGRDSFSGGDGLRRSSAPDGQPLRADPVAWPQAGGSPPTVGLPLKGKQRNMGQQGKLSTEQPLPPDYVAKQESLSQDGAAPDSPQEMDAAAIIDAGMDAAETTAHELSRIDTLPRRLDRDVRQHAAKHFMPGWKFNYSIFAFTVILCALSFATVLAYLHFIYQDDRSASLERWATAREGVPAQLEERPHHEIRPDIIMVFPTPNHEKSEKDARTVIPTGGLDNIMVDDNDKDLFCKLEELRRAAKSGEEATRGAAREALLTDMAIVMERWSFDINEFASIDKDEVFLCFSLRKPATQHFYLAKTQPMLQVVWNIAEKLGVDQDPDDPCSTAPFLAYSSATLANLQYSKIIESAQDTALYKSFRVRDMETCLSSKECIRTIYTELVSHVDLNSAEDHGLIVKWYAAHDPAELATLKAIWADWKYMKDFSFVQPVTLLKDYFGARIAFLFAWNGVYCKAMLPMCVVSIFQVVVVIFSQLSGTELVHQRQVVGFSIVLTLWSRFAINLWYREEHFLMELWGLSAFDDEGIIRPQFDGTMEKSPVDGNLTEKQAPNHITLLRHVISVLMTMFFCFVVVMFLFSWMVMFQGDANFISSSMLSIQIKVFQFCFRYMANKLTDFENHKYQDTYHNSLIAKLFTFEFVNNYSVFIFLTIKDSWEVDSKKGAALFQTQRQITVTLFVLSVMTMLQTPLQTAYMNFWLWYEHYQMKRANGGVEPEQMNFAEKQAKYKKMDEADEVQCTMTLIIALGFVLLFGGVSAWVVPFCFAVFAVQVRALAVMLTTNTQRTFPYRCRGMGYWCGIISFLNILGLGYSGFLFVAYGKSFQGAALLAKLTGFCLYCTGMFVLWAFVDVVFPNVDPTTTLLVRRRQYVLGLIQNKATHKELESHEDMAEKRARLRRGTTRTAMGDWDSLPSGTDVLMSPTGTPST